jgi:predicted aspartyl protease
MGYFSVPVQVGHPGILGGDSLPVDAVVDTGASDSMFPASLFERLHIEQEGEYRCVYANGDSEMRNYGVAAIRIGDRTNICPVIFGPDGHFLLGATTLEIFKFAVDPVAQELVPVPGLRLGWGGPL